MNHTRSSARPLRAMTAAFALAFALSAAAPAPAQGDATLEVTLQPEVAKLGEPVHIAVTVSSQGGALPRVKFDGTPDVEGLSFGEPRVGMNRSFMSRDARGRVTSSSSQTYSIAVRASAVGEYSIPPLDLVVGGERTRAPLEPLRLRVVEDMEAGDFLLFEREPLPEEIHEGEPFTLSIRFGWRKSMLADSLALHLPWWGRLDGVLELEQPMRGGAKRVPLRSPTAREASVLPLGEIERPNGVFTVFLLERRYVATRAGTLEIADSILEFKERRAGTFRTRDFYAPLETATIEVVPIPEEGRPFDFSGAVGDISISADAPRRDVDAGDVMTLEVTFGGEGNLEFFEAPKLDRMSAFDGFRVLGVREDRRPFERVITYDLIPMDASLEAIPSVELPVFDPEAERFERIASKPIAIRVTANTAAGDDPFADTDASEADEEPIVALRDIDATPVADEVDAGADRARGPSAAWSAALFAVALLGSISLGRRVRRRHDPASRAARERRGAAKALARDVRAAGDDPARLAEALERFLARRTGTPAGAWVGVSRLEAAPVDRTTNGASRDGVAAEFARLRDALDAARFGGRGEAGARGEDVLRIARALEREEVV